jgi:hypothetical protein
MKKNNKAELTKNKSSSIKFLSTRNTENPVKITKKHNPKHNNLTTMIKPDDSKALYSDRPTNSSRNNFRSLFRDSNTSTNVTTLQSARSSYNIYGTNKIARSETVNKDAVSPFKIHKSPERSTYIRDIVVEQDNYSIFHNTFEILNLCDKLRKELDFNLDSLEGIENILNSTSALNYSLCSSSERSLNNSLLDQRVSEFSDLRIKEYSKIFDECRDHLNNILEMVLYRNQKDKSTNKLPMIDSPKIKSRASKDLNPSIHLEKSCFVDYIHEQSSEHESLQEWIADEDDSQDIDLNMKLDNIERIKNLPRSKIQPVRMDKLIFSSDPCSPRNDTFKNLY